MKHNLNKCNIVNESRLKTNCHSSTLTTTSAKSCSYLPCLASALVNFDPSHARLTYYPAIITYYSRLTCYPALPERLGSKSTPRSFPPGRKSPPPGRKAGQKVRFAAVFPVGDLGAVLCPGGWGMRGGLGQGQGQVTVRGRVIQIRINVGIVTRGIF